MQNDLEWGECKICEEINPYLHIHHIDGNHKNNNKKNLIPICIGCHKLIEKGLAPKCYFLSDKIKEKILKYRIILLKKKYKMGNKEIKERVIYEKIISTYYRNQHLSKKKCYFCHKKRNLIHLVRKEIKKYHPNPLTRSFTVCKNCLKENPHLSKLSTV